MKILLVDNHEESLASLSSILKSHGYEITTAMHGAEALDKALHEPFDVIISDVLMPQMDGLQLCKAIKTHETLRHVAFIFYTASYLDPTDAALALSLGAEKYITKQQKPGVLLAVLQEVIRMQAAGLLAEPVLPSLPEDTVTLQQYNAHLIHQLEAKTLELQRLHEQLQKSEEKYRCLVENANDAIFLLDLRGRLRFVNPKFCELSGYTVSEAARLRFSRLLHPEDIASVMEYLSQRLAGEKPPGAYELRWLTKTGQTLTVDMNASVVVREGTIVGIQMIVRDITARQRTTEALRKSEERFAKAFHASPHAIVITRLADGRYVDANTSFLTWSGYTRDTLLGATAMALHRWVHPHDRERVAQLLREQGFVRDFGTQLLTRADQVREVRMSMELITLDDEPCLLSIIQDITERRHIETQLRQA
ncbi:MAG: PAS domain S-box protein, partial [Candidatus Tectomicrobia bacterium]|nr:PAS domain S-box protein [Candidatus Tectomicrobia bacterium]